MKKTRVQKNKRKYQRNLLLIIIKFIFKILFWIIKHIAILLYLIIHNIDLLVAKVYSKLPRLMRVGIIYILIFVAIWGTFDSKKQVALADKPNEIVKVMFSEYKEEEKEEEVNQETKKCVFGETECSIYNKAIEVGMTEEQALITVAISKHETGNWTSRAFKNKNNFGGIMSKTGLRNYSSYEVGLNAFVHLLKNRYFDKGLETIDKIGEVYCPIGATNDPTGVNKYWVPNVTNYYTSYKTSSAQ